MTQQQRFSNTLIAILAISILLMALISNGLVYRTQPANVIRVQDAIVLDDQAKVGLFVNELMNQRQASCLLWIFNKESHTNPKAKNPSSSARGIGSMKINPAGVTIAVEEQSHFTAGSYPCQ